MQIADQPSSAELELLRTSRDGRSLKRLAAAYAASPSAAAHAALGRFLSSSEFLNRLDEEPAYLGTYGRLRLARVMGTLAKNRVESVDRLLLGLIGAEQFQSHVLRMQLEVHTLAVLRPAPPEAITYWHALSQPGSPIAFDVIQALCENQSPPACRLLEQKFNDPGHDLFEKLDWLRTLFVPRRTAKPLLGCLARLLVTDTPEAVRIGIVEALFDYRPEHWYGGCRVPRPAPLIGADPEARRLLRQLGAYALEHIALTERLQARVQSTLRQLTDQPESNA